MGRSSKGAVGMPDIEPDCNNMTLNEVQVGTSPSSCDAASDVAKVNVGYFRLTENGSLVTDQPTEVKIPKQYAKDGYVILRQSELAKAYRLLEDARNKDKPWWLSDVCLGLATTLVGVVASSIVTGACLSSLAGVVTYCVFPAMIVGLLAKYFMLRERKAFEKRELAERVLDHLVDPEEVELEQNEY